MRDPNRIFPILSLLGKIWIKNPDLRLGQIIKNAQTSSGTNISTFVIEDASLLKGLIELDKVLDKHQKT